MSAWLLGWLIGSGVAAFTVNALWTIKWQRILRIAQRDHVSTCGEATGNQGGIGSGDVQRIEHCERADVCGSVSARKHYKNNGFDLERGEK